MTDAHENLGHRGEAAVFETVRTRFYWPYMRADVKHHVASCHECQIRSTRSIEVPLVISTPSTIWTKVYIDVMHMPRVGRYTHIVAARDDLTRASEGLALTRVTADRLADFFWENIYCRYGAVGQVTTDNGPEVRAGFTRLMDKLGIPHIPISPYNSKANGVVERGHFIIREAIVKSCGHQMSLWPKKVPAAFFADRVTVSQVTGYSPYFLLHGVEPVLPFDLVEATFMVEGFKSGMSPEDLLALRMRQLEKRPEDIQHAAFRLSQCRMKSKTEFEKKFQAKLMKSEFQPGELVLVRNSQVMKQMNRKTMPRYLGPYEIVR